MQALLTVFLSIFLSSCFDVNELTPFGKIVNKIKKKGEICRGQYNAITKPAVIENGSTISFVKNEKRALSIIKGYDPSHNLITLRDEAFIYLRKMCTSDKIKIFHNIVQDPNNCQQIFTDKRFMETLATAVSIYGWSDYTKRLGKEKIELYLKGIGSTDKSTVLEGTVALSIFRAMVETGIYSKRHLDFINSSIVESEKILNDLKVSTEAIEPASKNDCDYFFKVYFLEKNAQRKMARLVRKAISKLY